MTLRSPANVGHRHVQRGLRANVGQFALLVGVNALVGGMVGQERTLLPLLATDVFGVAGVTGVLTFLVAVGITKAGANLVAGAMADRFGRNPVLVVGWLIALPVPLLLIWAPTWGWIVLANVLLGLNQGLTWSTTVIMKIDLAGPRSRGLAMGLNEAAGYGAVAVSALATGAIAEAAGLRPAPFLLGLAYAGLGLAASVLFVRETSGHVAHEASARAAVAHQAWRACSSGQHFASRRYPRVVGDVLGISSAIWVVAVLTVGSGLIVLARMRETRPTA